MTIPFNLSRPTRKPPPEGMISSGLNPIDPGRRVKSYASAELKFGNDLIGLNSIDPCRRVKSYAFAELEFGHDLIGFELD
jgi:hypothetical protein